MGLTIQQLFDYIDGLTENKPGLVLIGTKDNEKIYCRIYLAHGKYYIDKINDIENKKDVDERNIFDKDELQVFKVKVMRLVSEINLEDIFIE